MAKNKKNIAKHKKPHHKIKKIHIAIASLVAVVVIFIFASVAYSQSKPTVAVIGDSISRQSEQEVRAALGSKYNVVYYNGINGVTIAGQKQNAINAVNSGNVDYLIIELGTNDAGQNRSEAQMNYDMRDFLNSVSSKVKCIRWYNIKNNVKVNSPVYNAKAPVFNSNVVQQVADMPAYGKTEVVDYNNWAVSNPSFFVGDDLHLNQAGENSFGQLARYAADTCDPVPTNEVFWDVDPNSPERNAVQWLGTERISGGYTNHTFRGSNLITRGAMIEWLWQASGAPTGFGPHGFRDVPASYSFDQAIRWAKATGVTTGYPDGTFRPGTNISRGALAQMLWVRAGAPTGFGPHGFRDVSASYPFNKAIRWAKATGVTTGYSDGTFKPGNSITRSAAAQFLWRSMGSPDPSPYSTSQ